MISLIKKNIRHLFKDDVKPLGRWSLVYDEKINRKADLSNEDHCGPCGTYILQQQEKNKTKIKELNRLNKTYIPGYKTFEDYTENLQNK